MHHVSSRSNRGSGGGSSVDHFVMFGWVALAEPIRPTSSDHAVAAASPLPQAQSQTEVLSRRLANAGSADCR